MGDATLNVRGNLTNLATLLGYSNSELVTAGTIAARNINNLQGALISSVLPGSLAANLGSVVNDFNLNLIAVRDIFNAGSITSAGNLSMTAGGSITNASTANAGAIMSAASNVNLALSAFAGSWTCEDLVAFEKNSETFEQIDPDMWK